MTQTTLEQLEQRVAALEREISGCARVAPPSKWKDWRQAIGSFVPSELSEEVDQAGREFRAADRCADEK